MDICLLLTTFVSDNYMSEIVQLSPAKSATLERHAIQLNEALADLIRAYQVRDRDCICCHDISVTQCNALESLEDGPLTLGELATKLLLDKSTTSRVVDALQRKGYVERHPHPDDRRALHIQMTRTGRALYQLIERALQEQGMQLLAEFTPEVREAAIKIIGQIAGVAISRARETAGCCAA